MKGKFKTENEYKGSSFKECLQTEKNAYNHYFNDGTSN